VRPPALLVERCRRALSRHIAHAHASSGTLEALLLDPAAEATLREALAESVLAVDPATAEALLEQIGAALADRDRGAPVLLAPTEVRRPLRQLIAARYPRMPVLSYEELPPTLAVQPVGRLELAHREGAPESVAMAAA
jgi:type III secretion protein V